MLGFCLATLTCVVEVFGSVYIYMYSERHDARVARVVDTGFVSLLCIMNVTAVGHVTLLVEIR